MTIPWDILWIASGAALCICIRDRTKKMKELLDTLLESEFEDIFQPLSDEEVKDRGLTLIKAGQDLEPIVKERYPEFQVGTSSNNRFAVYQPRRFVDDVSEEELKELITFVKAFLKGRGIHVEPIIKKLKANLEEVEPGEDLKLYYSISFKTR